MQVDELEAKIRKQIFDELHKRVLPRLRGLGLLSVAIVSDPKTDFGRIRFTLAQMDAKLRDVNQEILNIVSPPSHQDYIRKVNESLSQARFQEHINQDLQSIRELGVSCELICSPREIEWLNVEQYLPIQDILFNWLGNMVEHAKASNVFIELVVDNEKKPKYFTLRVTNDGQGNESLNDIDDFVNALPPEHTGLRAIKDAVRRLEANWQVNSSLLTGTTLTIRQIPVLSK